MDNIVESDIDLDAIEAEHQKLFQLYKDSAVPEEILTLDSILDSVDAPLLVEAPVSEISCTGTGYFGSDTLDKSMISLTDRSQPARLVSTYPGTRGDYDCDYSDQMRMFDNDEQDPRGQSSSYRGFRKGAKKTGEQGGQEADVFGINRDIMPSYEEYKPSKGHKNKDDKWAVHAWEDDSEEDMNVIFDRLAGVEGNVSDGEFADLGTSPDPWGGGNAKSHSKPLNNEHLAQIQEKNEEIAVTIDKVSTDTAELMRDMGELLPLASDTNEDVRSLNTEVSKLTKRVTSMEQSIKKLETSMSGLNNLMQIIVDHLQTNTI